MTPKKVVDPDAPEAAGGGSVPLPSSTDAETKTEIIASADESPKEEAPSPVEAYVTQADMSMMMDDIQNRFELQQQVFNQQQSAIMFKLEELFAANTANPKIPVGASQQPTRTNPTVGFGPDEYFEAPGSGPMGQTFHTPPGPTNTRRESFGYGLDPLNNVTRHPITPIAGDVRGQPIQTLGIVRTIIQVPEKYIIDHASIRSYKLAIRNMISHNASTGQFNTLVDFTSVELRKRMINAQSALGKSGCEFVNEVSILQAKDETFKDYFANTIRFEAMFTGTDGSQQKNILTAFHKAAGKMPCREPRIDNWHLSVFAHLRDHVEEIYKNWEILFRDITHEELTALKIKYVWGKEGNSSNNYEEGFLQHCMSVLDGNDFSLKEHGRGPFCNFFTRHFEREEKARWQSVADWKDAMLKANKYYATNSHEQQKFRERTSPPLTVALVTSQIGKSRFTSRDDKEYPPLSKSSGFPKKKSSKQTSRSANWKKVNRNRFSVLSSDHDPEGDTQPADQEVEFPDDPLRQAVAEEEREFRISQGLEDPDDNNESDHDDDEDASADEEISTSPDEQQVPAETTSADDGNQLAAMQYSYGAAARKTPEVPARPQSSTNIPGTSSYGQRPLHGNQRQQQKPHQPMNQQRPSTSQVDKYHKKNCTEQQRKYFATLPCRAKFAGTCPRGDDNCALNHTPRAMAEMEKSLLDLLQQHKRTHRDSAPSGRVYMLTRPSITLTKNHPDYTSPDETDIEETLASGDVRPSRALIQFLGDDHAGKEMVRRATT
jgi:hypothetical protein